MSASIRFLSYHSIIVIRLRQINLQHSLPLLILLFFFRIFLKHIFSNIPFCVLNQLCFQFLFMFLPPDPLIMRDRIFRRLWVIILIIFLRMVVAKISSGRQSVQKPVVFFVITALSRRAFFLVSAFLGQIEDVLVLVPELSLNFKVNELWVVDSNWTLSSALADNFINEVKCFLRDSNVGNLTFF